MYIPNIYFSKYKFFFKTNIHFNWWVWEFYGDNLTKLKISKVKERAQVIRLIAGITRIYWPEVESQKLVRWQVRLAVCSTKYHFLTGQLRFLSLPLSFLFYFILFFANSIFFVFIHLLFDNDMKLKGNPQPALVTNAYPFVHLN